MNTTSWNFNLPVPPPYTRRALNREMTISLIASMLLVGFFAFVFVVGEAVQESRAASDITGASKAAVSKQQPERSGVLSAQMPAF
jgi:hypothetical protein